jgi:4-phytase / acid phosphatase
MKSNIRIVLRASVLALITLFPFPSGLTAFAANRSASPSKTTQKNLSLGVPELKFVVILNRHGVRSPTWTNQRLDLYSAESWPEWSVPPGYLTKHGSILMRLFGAYDHAYLSQHGLLDGAGCSSAGGVYIWADTDERTLATGRALAEGMLPGCNVQVHSRPKGKRDPLFHPFRAGIKPPDPRLVLAAVSGRIGNNPESLDELYRPQLERLQDVLLDCKPGKPCPPTARHVKRSIFDTPASLNPAKGDSMAAMAGPLDIGSTFSEDFLLEYTNGMVGRQLGWGRVNENNMRDMLMLHGVYVDLMRQTPYIARARAANLLSHILATMRQAAGGRAVPGALGKPDDRVAVLVGHDTNISNVAGALHLSWLVQGYRRDETPPGGALVFELWQEPSTGNYTVRTYYMCQTLDQMRNALPLTLDSPPARAPIFVPGCGTANSGLACGWKQFQATIKAAIEPAFVKP